MKTVWINGCFDVLHHGHFKLIDFAASLGDYLVVGMDTDRRVKESKGVNRPYHNEKERKYNLMSIKGVNRVVLFDNNEELCWHLRDISPYIRVIGSDYRDKFIVGKEICSNIVFFERLNYSTTEILSATNN